MDIDAQFWRLYVKKFALPLITTILLTGVLTSCDNFLKGAEIKEEIESQIAYANAPAYKIRVEYPQGCGVIKSPAGGEIEKKVTDRFNVSLDTDSDWEFIRWKIVDFSTKEEIPDGTYLKLESPDMPETECTFVSAPNEGMDLCLEAVLAERPQILSCTPLYGTGVCKDTAIQVMFDHDMDPDSIYYSEEEIQKLKDAGIPDENFLRAEVNGKTRYYGYCKYLGRDNGDVEQNFKNITITNNNTNSNMNKYFLAPEFQTPRLLCIPVNLEYSISDWSQIIVQLEKSGFFYYEGVKQVSMASMKKWIYQVSDQIDTEPPSVSSGSVWMNISATQQRNLTAFTQDYLSEIPSPDYILTPATMQVDCSISMHDNESGPSSEFLLGVKRMGSFDSSETFKASPSAIKYKGVSYLGINGPSAIFNGKLDISDMNLSPGVYGITFSFSDRSGRSTVYPSNDKMYFFQIKDTSPIPTPTDLTVVSKTSDSVRIAWLIPGDNFDQYSINWEGCSENGETYSGSDTFNKRTLTTYTINGTKGGGYLNVSLWTKTSAGVEGTHIVLNAYEPVCPSRFFMPIEDKFSSTGRGTIVTGRIEKGTVRPGDRVQIVGMGKKLNAKVQAIEMFSKTIPSASTGDNVGIVLGEDISTNDVSRGMALCTPGEMQDHKKFKAFIYLRTREEGGKSNSVSSGYRPQFYLGNTDISGTTSFSGQIDPGTEAFIDVDLVQYMPIYAGQQFLVREGGRTVGTGVIISIND